jgi:hypothetical protein
MVIAVLRCGILSPDPSSGRVDDPTMPSQREAKEEPMGAMNDPANALERRAIAWARFRRMMRWMALVAVLTIIVALVYLAWGDDVLTGAMVLATIGGVGGSVLLAAALMLLAFMSSGTGHDDEAGRHP